MMANPDIGTLAYTQSPKTSRRTTFQDELKAAISARVSKTNTRQYSYSDDFNEEEDDFLNQLIRARKKKAGALKAGKSKAKIINDFEVSDDDEGKPGGRTKRVSFLKSQRVEEESPSEDRAESRENKPPDSPDSPVSPGSVPGSHNSHNNNRSPSSSQRSATGSEDTIARFKSSDAESTAEPDIGRRGSSKSLSYQMSDDTDLPLPFQSTDNSGSAETPGPDKTSDPQQTPPLPATDIKRIPSSESPAERERPRPKPRQRTFAQSARPAEKISEEDAESQGPSRPQTSSASIPLSIGVSSIDAWSEGDGVRTGSLSKSSSGKSGLSQVFTKSTVDSGSGDGFISSDSREQERKYSTSFEELTQDSGDQSDPLSQVHDKSFDTRTSSSPSQRSQSVCSRKVESKYLGSLKVLDRKGSLQESRPQAADSLRAAVYQEWLQKKKEKSRENARVTKKNEELLKEKKKREEEAKREDAVASYEAWKKNKAESLRAKAKEEHDRVKKAQSAMEEREEKRLSAKEVFEKWKHDHEHLLKEKYKEQRRAESKQLLKKREKEEERNRDCKSAFSNWREKKTDILHEKVTSERREIQNKVEEERYMKEERDKVALDMYEIWLVRKDLEHKRQREERRVQAILRDSPPPPWSPPNKTVPFRK